jgi:hypothetical protein
MMSAARRRDVPKSSEAYPDWLREEEKARQSAAYQEWKARLRVENESTHGGWELRLRAEDREREKAYEEEWEAWHAAASREMRGPGRPAADSEGLLDAAVWLTHLFPGATHAHRLADVVDNLLACKANAVRRLVGKAKRKRLHNRLAPDADSILTPDAISLEGAAEWAEREDLPALPLEVFANTVLADQDRKIINAPTGRPWRNLDGLLLARAVRDCGVAERLPPEAREALQRLLEREAEG